MQQLKTVYFSITGAEWEKLALHLKERYGSELIPNSFDPMKTTNAGSTHPEKRRYSASVPKSFPMSEEQWVIDLVVAGEP